MERTSAQIRRPGLLGAVAAATALAGACACLSLLNLAAVRRADPVEIRAGGARLEAVLASAPAARIGGAGPVVWAVTAPDCAECGAFAAEDLNALRNDGFDVRVVSLPLEGRGAGLRGAVADVVERNGAALRLPALFWRRGNEWRGALGRDPMARARLHADLDTVA
jgi:hypothetical protein